MTWRRVGIYKPRVYARAYKRYAGCTRILFDGLAMHVRTYKLYARVC